MTAFRWLKVEIAAGRRAPLPARCEMCSQDQGAIQYHSEDYSAPYGDNIGQYGLCVEDHMILHTRFTHPNRWLRRCLTAARGEKSTVWASTGHYFKRHPYRPDERELDPMFEWPELAALTPTWWLALKLYKIDLKETWQAAAVWNQRRPSSSPYTESSSQHRRRQSH